MNNLANDSAYSEIKNRLENQMKQKLVEQNDPRILGNGDVFDNYEYHGTVQNYYNRFMAGEDIPAGWVNKSDYELDIKE